MNRTSYLIMRSGLKTIQSLNKNKLCLWLSVTFYFVMPIMQVCQIHSWEPTGEDMATFYSQFSAKNKDKHLAYNKEWWTRNFKMVVPGLKAHAVTAIREVNPELLSKLAKIGFFQDSDSNDTESKYLLSRNLGWKHRVNFWLGWIGGYNAQGVTVR